MKRPTAYAKRKQTKEIRAAVWERSDGRCENPYCSGWGVDLSDLDHFWGRKNAPQSVENCWRLCRRCHTAKTHNEPSRLTWLQAFLKHAASHHYDEQAQVAIIAIGFNETKADLSFLREGLK